MRAAKQGKLRVVIKVKWLSYFLPIARRGIFLLEESQLIRKTSDSKMMEFGSQANRQNADYLIFCFGMKSGMARKTTYHKLI